MTDGNKLLIDPFISFLAPLPGPNAGEEQKGVGGAAFVGSQKRAARGPQE